MRAERNPRIEVISFYPSGRANTPFLIQCDATFRMSARCFQMAILAEDFIAQFFRAIPRWISNGNAVIDGRTPA
jgi:hypothetical protein